MFSGGIGGLFGTAAAKGQPANAPQKKPTGPMGGGQTITGPFGPGSASQSGAGVPSNGRPASNSGSTFGSTSQFGMPGGGMQTGSTGRSGSNAGMPSSSEGDIFGSLNLMSNQSATPSPPGGLLSGLNVAGSATAPAMPQATGFDFLGSGSGASAPPAATGFDFMGGGGSAPAPAPSGFSFTSSAAVPAPVAAPAPAASLDAGDGGVKKRKPGFRPGFERSGADSGAGPAMLTGLTLHGQGEGEAQGAALGLLAGMVVHAEPSAVEAETAPEPPAWEQPASSSSTFARLLSVTQAAPALPTAAASGFNFPLSASLPSVSAPSTSSHSSDPTSAKKSAVAALNEAARSTRLRLADVKIRIRALGDEDRAAGVQVERLRARLGEIEASQDEAVRTEAFDDAERLAEQLDSVRGSLSVGESKRDGVRMRKRMAEEEQEATLAEQLAVTQECLAALQSYESERVGSLSSFLACAGARHTSGAERLKGEEEQLRLKEEQLARESVLVTDEADGVERAIGEQTEELSRTVAELRERHSRLTSEVAELERLLEAKRKEARGAASQLTDAETRIATIRAKFDKQIKRLATKRSAVDAEKEECTSEGAALARAKKEYAAAKAKDRAAERGMLRQAGYAALDVSTLSSLRSALVTQEGQRRQLAGAAAVGAVDAGRAAGEVERAARALRTLHARKAALEAQAGACRKTIIGIDAKIPALKEEKNAAVTGKKFKEAARVNDELKRLSDSREAAEKELSAATSGIDAAEHEALGLEADQSACKQALADVEKACDLARISLLTDAYHAAASGVRYLSRALAPVTTSPSVKQVDAVTLDVCGAQDDSSDPADGELGIEVEDGSCQSFVQTGAIELLTAQRNALSEELHALAGRHGVVLALESREKDEEGGEGAQETPASPSPPMLEAPTSEVFSLGAAFSYDTNASTSGWSPRADASSASSSSLAFMAAGVQPTGFSFGQTADSCAPLSTPPPASGFCALLGGEGVGVDPGLSDASSSLLELVDGGAAGVERDDSPPRPPVYTSSALASARLLRLKRAAQAVAAVSAAVEEKEGLISEAVGRDEFDVADALQADIDDMLAHRARLLDGAAALGVASEEELAGCIGLDVDEEEAESVPEDVDVVAAAVAAGGGGGEGATGSAAPVATGFSFM